MDLFSESIKIVQDVAVKAAGSAGKVSLLQTPEPRHVYTTINQAGEIELHDAQPEPRAHLVDTLEEIVKFAANQSSKDSIVWFDGDKIVVVLDDATRRDQASLILSNSPHLRSLQALEKSGGRSFEQKELRKFLRVTMAETWSDSSLLNFIQSVRWNSQWNSAGVVNKSKESLGRDIEETVTGADGSECPDDITFNVRVFDDPGLLDTWPIKVAVDMDIREQKFQLVPYPGYIQKAIDNEVAAIGERIRAGVECKVYRGRP